MAFAGGNCSCTNLIIKRITKCVFFFSFLSVARLISMLALLLWKENDAVHNTGRLTAIRHMLIWFLHLRFATERMGKK